jgi:MSHA biogenesis protein MshE
VHGVIAQRLVRRVCPDCARPAPPSPNELAWLASFRPDCNLERATLSVGAGCTYCNLTGYRGRIAVYELLEIDRALADAIRRDDLHGFSRAAPARAGYVPLAQSALDLALSGVTSLAEAMAVSTGLDDAPLAEPRVAPEPTLGEPGVDRLLERSA